MSAPEALCPKCGDEVRSTFHKPHGYSGDCTPVNHKEHWSYRCSCGYAWAEVWRESASKKEDAGT